MQDSSSMNQPTKLLSISECAELVNIQEARRCLAVTLDYLETKEAEILGKAKSRQPKGGPVNEAD